MPTKAQFLAAVLIHAVAGIGFVSPATWNTLLGRSQDIPLAEKEPEETELEEKLEEPPPEPEEQLPEPTPPETTPDEPPPSEPTVAEPTVVEIALPELTASAEPTPSAAPEPAVAVATEKPLTNGAPAGAGSPVEYAAPSAAASAPKAYEGFVPQMAAATPIATAPIVSAPILNQPMNDPPLVEPTPPSPAEMESTIDPIQFTDILPPDHDGERVPSIDPRGVTVGMIDAMIHSNLAVLVVECDVQRNGHGIQRYLLDGTLRSPSRMVQAGVATLRQYSTRGLMIHRKACVDVAQQLKIDSGIDDDSLARCRYLLLFTNAFDYHLIGMQQRAAKELGVSLEELVQTTVLFERRGTTLDFRITAATHRTGKRQTLTNGR